MQEKQILIAAGGTGGHLFPAQALAEELKEAGHEPLFAGAGLKSNPFFDRGSYRYYDVPSMTPFGGKKALLKAPWVLLKGGFISLKILKQESVSVVVGFGSYHTFPLLLAAKLRRIPLVLFEPNARAGKVNRLFAKGARFTALQFTGGRLGLKGDTRIVSALTRRMERVAKEAAAAYFSLSDRKKTLLIFGGSQGAKTLNQYLHAISMQLKPFAQDWQVIHIVGNNEDPIRFKTLYDKVGLTACVKSFESKMAWAWSLADLVVSRSGASTIAEQLHFAVPAVYIPLPHATEDHQTKNAEVIQELGGAMTLAQSQGATLLLKYLHDLMSPGSTKKESMKNALEAVKENSNQQQLSSLLMEVLKHGRT